MNRITNYYEDKGNDFIVPAGIYRAKLRTVTWILHKPGGGHTDCRLLFDIVANKKGPVDYCIRKLYCPQSDSYDELLPDLRPFFTDEEAEAESGGVNVG